MTLVVSVAIDLISSNSGQLRPLTAKLAATERQNMPYILIMGKNGVSAFSRLFL